LPEHRTKNEVFCKNCTFFKECVVATKRKARRLTLSPGYEFLQERREIQETETFREEMKVRAQVEGTISEEVRFFGLRHEKYKGENKHRP